MSRVSRTLLGCTVVSLCIAITVSAQESPSTGDRVGRMGGAIPGGAGRGGNTMVSMTPPANVNRIKLPVGSVKSATTRKAENTVNF
jgi:hypothetical protein